jgi:hypothetical protein
MNAAAEQPEHAGCSIVVLLAASVHHHPEHEFLTMLLLTRHCHAGSAE